MASSKIEITQGKNQGKITTAVCTRDEHLLFFYRKLHEYIKTKPCMDALKPNPYFIIHVVRKESERSVDTVDPVLCLTQNDVKTHFFTGTLIFLVT